ncbi:MAG: AarF/ABC1/UbiB kinase family protein [Proteobacteria bacterium]|nr:AarF/ABC1/UbiB kinase family protein [Pseudomonadota bacterium]
MAESQRHAYCLFMIDDPEQNRLSARMGRYAKVGANVGGVAARMAGTRLFGGDSSGEAALLRLALGRLKGPLVKVAQLMATIPDLLPADYAAELQTLQADAPAMGWVFVKRRMASELGADWQKHFASFDRTAAAAASLGQVHKATLPDGMRVACKLQYPDMASVVEADLQQLKLLFALHRQFDGVIDTSEVAHEIADRVREELDYVREAGHARLYGAMLADEPLVRVPRVVDALSTRRLLTLEWLDGTRMLTHKEATADVRNRLAQAMFQAWWLPFIRHGVIHGDPHLGNYTVFDDDGAPGGINLLDYGCIRIFPPRFVGGVVDLYEGLRTGERDRIVHAYETWGFRKLSPALVDTLNIWARFIFGPLLDDRARTIADGVKPSEYGRREVFRVRQELRRHGALTIPREFLFMDRAAIGLGAVFLHLNAELNFYRLFNTAMGSFSSDAVANLQADALHAAELAR